jgi:hypothetical protein
VKAEPENIHIPSPANQGPGKAAWNARDVEAVGRVVSSVDLDVEHFVETHFSGIDRFGAEEGR